MPCPAQGEGDVEGVVEGDVLPQGPRSASDCACHLVAKVDQWAAGEQELLRRSRRQLATQAAPPEDAPDLRVDQMRRVAGLVQEASSEGTVLR